MNKAKIKRKFTVFIHLSKSALRVLLKNDPLRMAGATAFFTTFALPPILVILTQVLGLVFSTQRVRQQLIERLMEYIGSEAVEQVVNTLSAFRRLAQNGYIIAVGFLFLLFVATTLFKVIKSSVNEIWRIKLVKSISLWKGLRSRLKSVIVILFAGILFVVGLVGEGIQAFVGSYIFELSPLVAAYFNSVLNYIVSLLVVTAWFFVVFRYLPDGRPSWKIALTGAFCTGLLFTVGKVVLRWLLTYSNINTIFGASASIVLLLLFVFYSSLILYFGAAFTKVWAAHRREPIKPLPGAIAYKLTLAEEREQQE